jgi:hypothetical protein
LAIAGRVFPGLAGLSLRFNGEDINGEGVSNMLFSHLDGLHRARLKCG